MWASAAGRARYALIVAVTSCNPERLTAPPSVLATPRPVVSTAAPHASSAAPRAPAQEPTRAGPEPVTPPEKLPVFATAWLTALGPNGARKLQIAASICAAALKHDGAKLLVGCRSCPPFDASTGPDREVAVDPEGDFYELEAVITGSFTRPGAQEAAAVFNGCEPHAANFGGTLLVEQGRGVWMARSYRAGFHPAECQAFTRPDGRDILVCSWVTDHQGNAHHLLDSYDFTRGSEQDSEAGWEHILSLDDNSYAKCFDPPERKDTIVADSLRRFRLEQPKKGGSARLVVDARFSHSAPSAAFTAKCRELVRKAETDERVDVQRALEFSERRLVFEWQRERFEPDAATRAQLRALGVSDAASAP